MAKIGIGQPIPNKVDNRVKIFKERYLKQQPWNYLVSPSRPLMALWVHPGGTAQEEPMDAPVDTGPNGPRVFKMPLLTDLKGQDANIAEIERLRAVAEEAKNAGQDADKIKRAVKAHMDKEALLKNIILKMVFGKEV